MHIPTHILSGWCVANLLPLTAKQRLACMVAATAADLDGISYALGETAYWDYHHAAGHNVFAAVVVAGVLAILTPPRRGLAFAAYVGLFHLHLVLDYFGSGPGWPIHYLWPVSRFSFRNPYAWPFFSWQNIATATALIAWAVWIAARVGRTPVELITPRLDGEFVAAVRRWMPGRSCR
jgi:hypothetical protein